MAVKLDISSNKAPVGVQKVSFMLVLSGSRVAEQSQDEFLSLIRPYQQIHVDVGTGDARNIYKAASRDQTSFYIGIDPIKDNMLEISKKLLKKPAKGGLKNVLLIIAAVEHLPAELTGIADSVSVYFPWGSLLECVIKPLPDSLSNIVNMMKSGASFEFVTTYSDSYEESEISRRELPALSLQYFSGDGYVSALRNLHLTVTDVKEYDNEYVKKFNSLWAKRLAFGRKRSFFRVTGYKSDQ